MMKRAASSGAVGSSDGGAAAKKRRDSKSKGAAGDGNEKLIEQMVDAMYADSRLVVPMFTHMQSKMDELGSADDDTNVLAHAQTWDASTLARLPQDYKIEFLASVSDATPSQLLKMLKVDQASVNSLLQLGIQIPGRMKLPEKAKYSEVLRRFISQRYQDCGKRLEKFVRKGGLKADGGLDLLKAGVYSLQWTEQGLLSGVKHMSGDEARIPEGAHITKNYVLLDNSDDMGASLQLPPMAPVKLAGFFAGTQQGPFRVKAYTGKPKELEADLEAVFRQWEAEARGAFGKTEAREEIAQGLEEHKKELQAATMQRARAQAAKAMAKKNATRRISLDG